MEGLKITFFFIGIIVEESLFPFFFSHLTGSIFSITVLFCFDWRTIALQGYVGFCLQQPQSAALPAGPPSAPAPRPLSIVEHQAGLPEALQLLTSYLFDT